MRKDKIFKNLAPVWSRFKPYGRWVVLGGTLFFLAAAFKEHWQEVSAIRIGAAGWATLAIALGVTMLAHTWSGWVWTWIIRELDQPVNNIPFIQVYLKTNVAKYLPGNVWHFYGRIVAAKNAGVPADAATLSVLLEPLLMSAAALAIALLGIQPAAANSRFLLQGLPILGLVTVLVAVHPRFLNLAIRYLGRVKLKVAKSATANPNNLKVQRYPLRPLLGELGFIILRGIGFLLTLLALIQIEFHQIPILFGAFSLAWLLGLVIPVAPGGIGVFEATAIALLGSSYSPGLLLSAIALYRVISILAEAAGAILAWLDEHITFRRK